VIILNIFFINGRFKEILNYFLAIPPSIIASILTIFWIRNHKLSSYKNKFPISGTYHKFNSTGIQEKLKDKPLIVKIYYIEDMIFGIEEEFSFTGEITKSEGSFEIENIHSGIGNGAYQHIKNGDQIPDNGLYHLKVDLNHNLFNNRIWIGYENLYPYHGRNIGSYYLLKVN
jgi:hypothetical protein